MRDSGEVLNWNFDGPVIDKHSTGGVGDCVSLVLAPALAECGAYVPMISGRGLGHTGGTLDKLEAIPGVTHADRAGPPDADSCNEIGAAIVGATGQIAPADKRLYAVRDVTGNGGKPRSDHRVDPVQEACGQPCDALVLDVKARQRCVHENASTRSSKAGARRLTETANAAGCRTSAVITDMDQPLAPGTGQCAGGGRGDEGADKRKVPCRRWPKSSAELGGTFCWLMLECAIRFEDGYATKIAPAIIRDGRAAERFRPHDGSCWRTGSIC